ncbi:tRNA (adenosine(37)-N6)-threonylcarbamoyltransferase complex dimerization subunit type 1 TsaB, partial [Sedimentibacter sp. B4]|uniref:tRNA (adenosine(37)-N6)-threonylcarbamoyltransferase complex dimerization subunit type 1 TsaB n=1 Tax=Sedimentibacter sp. B4 TaxID=304766 RepID=UPI0009FBD432
MVRRVLAEAGAKPAELSGIAVGVGPGPFTGLRVGVAAAVTMAEALGIPVRGVCSLDVVALEWAGRPDAPSGE